MIILKFLGKYVFLLEIKERTPDFPKIHSTPAPRTWWDEVKERGEAELRKKRAAFYQKNKKIIDKYFSLLLGK